MSRYDDMTAEQRAARRDGRWQVACCNWGHNEPSWPGGPRPPHAMSYLAMPSGMLFEEFHQTHAEAVERVSRMVGDHLDRFAREHRLRDASPVVIRQTSVRRWRLLLGDQGFERDQQAERDDLLAVRVAHQTHDEPPRCECAMTESSLRRCPMHGEHAPPEV